MSYIIYIMSNISYMSYMYCYTIYHPLFYIAYGIFFIIGVKLFCGQFWSTEKHCRLEMRFVAVESEGLKFKTCLHSWPIAYLCTLRHWPLLQGFRQCMVLTVSNPVRLTLCKTVHVTQLSRGCAESPRSVSDNCYCSFYARDNFQSCFLSMLTQGALPHPKVLDSFTHISLNLSWLPSSLSLIASLKCQPS